MTCTHTPTCAECAEKMMDELPPLPEREGQPRTMVVEDSQIGCDIEIGAIEVGTWYSPSFVNAYAAAAVAKERERCAKLCEDRANDAWVHDHNESLSDEYELLAKTIRGT